jgi:hypothetical protein
MSAQLECHSIITVAPAGKVVQLGGFPKAGAKSRGQELYMARHSSSIMARCEVGHRASRASNLARSVQQLAPVQSGIQHR